MEELGPEEGYRTKIDFAQRLTWGGEFIHAAPWSEGQQGSVNVSHGCVNVSMANGDWLFKQHPDRRPDHGQGHRAQAPERQRLDRLEHELGRVRQGQRPAVRPGRRPAEPGRRRNPDAHAHQLSDQNDESPLHGGGFRVRQGRSGALCSASTGATLLGRP